MSVFTGGLYGRLTYIVEYVNKNIFILVNTSKPLVFSSKPLVFSSKPLVFSSKPLVFSLLMFQIH